MGAPATPPPPEATLIRLAREASGLSPETAAARMEIKFSGSRWRQIEKGHRRDSDTAVVAPHPTLAHMAWALGITSDRLAETGRHEAADILREMERSKAPAQPASVETAPLAELEEWQQKVILNALDERPRSAREKALLLRTLAAQIEAEAAAEPTESATDLGGKPGRSAS
ncbi:helix-turn-helix domain-containing protein [Streptomyces murinus]|uniref:helix-turn-helix domain-containing protein n=1 Tax=Streptomyces murinus TaxID=33900 RepID=UPI000A22885D|nr:helix-turn-helix domain-containing protein [Streptomyces murinus]WDO09893.1 helix-turn-helix domain-containing protein [Streptomyces murinus]